MGIETIQDAADVREVTSPFGNFAPVDGLVVKTEPVRNSLSLIIYDQLNPRVWLRSFVRTPLSAKLKGTDLTTAI